MTQTLPLIGIEEEGDGVIGTRQLVAVQTFFVSRLTSHPVVLVPGTFVAVTGRGPRGDSNGSGKTSFLAAVSLLLGDREWQLAGGAKAPTALLFDARAAGGHGDSSTSASHGYVVGLFADPDRVHEQARTVWLRIDTSPQYVTVRWTDGNALVVASSDREAHDLADAAWQALPRTDHGFNRYARVLYGDAPRCLAYVQQRGDAPNKPSLLQMSAGKFTPAQIGDSLIRLTGQRQLLDTEQEHRRVLADQVRQLDEQATEHERRWRDETAQLEDVTRRDSARDAVATAHELWRKHFAAGLLETTERAADLKAELDEAQLEVDGARSAHDTGVTALEELRSHADGDALAARVDQARIASERAEEAVREADADLRRALDERTHLSEELARQRVIAAGGVGLDVADAEQQLVEARTQRDQALGARATALAREHSATETLTAVEHGGHTLVGATLAVLRAAGIAADGLLDSTTVRDDKRAFWEPVLSLWSEAVVVREPSQVRDALTAARGLPGAVLLSPDPDGEPPDGIATFPPGATRFLRHLTERFADVEQPASVADVGHGVHVIGGFPDPIAGRDARRALAQRALDTARDERVRADASLALAEAEVAASEHERDCSLARTKVVQLAPRIVDLDEDIPNHRARCETLEAEASTLREDRAQALAEQTHHTSLIAGAEREVELTGDSLHAANTKSSQIERELAALPLEYWERGWGASLDEARTLLDADYRRAVTFRRAATDLLNRATWELGIRTHEDAPTPQLAAALASRDAGRDDDESSQAAPFEAIATALTNYLDGWRDTDRIVEATISRDRAQREQERATLESAVTETSESLERIQDAAATLIEGSLQTIGATLDEMRREAGLYGARLEIDAVRPLAPGEMWEWNVVPHWQRVHSGPHTRYDTRANTAQEKLFTVHLVLAALLAAPNPRGRVLILDELGDSLGDEHRRQVLSAITTTAERTGITVLGTCQDSVLADAAACCGEILYFEHVADTEALNRPTRMFGFDASDRVELTRDAVTASRPPV